MSDSIASLVGAVREHRRFKQMVVYSIGCVSKVIAPPNAQWRRNVDAACDSGAASCVIDVLKLHAGKEDVLLECTECLRKLAVDPTNADLIAGEGGVEAVLDSIQSNPDLPSEVVGQALMLLDSLCSHSKALQKLMDSGTVTKVLQLLQSHGSDPAIAAACIRALEKMTKSQAGIDAFMQGQGVPVLLSSLDQLSLNEFHEEGEDEVIVAGLKILNRLGRTDDAATAIKDAGGMDVCLHVLDSYGDHQGISRVAGKILSRICGDSIEELVATLQAGGMSSQAVEHTMSLLASLAMDSASSDEIVKSGGVGALVGSYEAMASARAMESVAKTLARLAANPRNVAELVESGAITTLLRGLTSGQGSPDSIAATVEALTRICAALHQCNDIVQAGGVAAVLSALSQNVGDAGVAAASMEFLDTISQAGDVDVSNVLDENSIGWIVHTLNTHQDDATVQVSGTRALTAIAGNENAVRQMLNAGAVEVAVRNMTEHGDDSNIVKESMNLLASMLLVPETEAKIRELGAFSTVVNAVCANLSNASVRGAAMELVEMLSSEELVRVKVAELLQIANKVSAGQHSPEDMATVPPLAMSLGTLAMIPTNVQLIADAGGVAPLAILTNAVADMAVCPDHEDVLVSLMTAQLQVLQTTDSLYGSEEAVIAACVTVLNTHARKKGAATEALKLLLQMLQSNSAVTDTMIGAGVVDGAGLALRTHAEDPEVCEAAVQLLALIGQQKEEAAVELAKKNATRALISCVTKNAEKDGTEFEAAFVAIFQALEAVASTTEGFEIVSKQGAVNAIFDAMDNHATNKELADAGVRAITALNTADDVLRVLTRIQEKYTANFIRNARPEQLEKVSTEVDRLGLLLMCGDFATILTEAGGLQTLQDIMVATQDAPPCRERTELIQNCIKAFGRAAAGKVQLDNAIAIVPLLLDTVQNNPTVESVRAVGFLAEDETLRAALIQQGATGAILRICETATSDQELLNASFSTLATFSRDATGGREIVTAGGLGFVCEYIAETLYGGNVKAINEAVALLHSIAELADAEQLVGGGVLEVLNDVLDVLAAQSSAQPETLSRVLGLLAQLATTPAGANAIIEKNLVNKIVAMLERNDDYLRDPDCVRGLVHLLDQLVEANGDLATKLHEIGVQDIMLKAMNYNPNDMELITAAAKTLGLITGGQGGSSVETVVPQLDQLVEQIRSGSHEAVAELLKVVQLTGNLMLLSGAMEPKVVSDLSRALQGAVATLRDVETDEAQEAIAACLSTLARLTAADEVDVDVDSLTTTVKATMEDSRMMHNAAVMNAACACVGTIARSTTGLQTIVSKSMVTGVQKAAHQKAKVGVSSSSGMQDAVQALDVLTQQAISNAALLVGTEGGSAAIADILNGITDPRELASTVAQILPKEGGLQALLEVLTHLLGEDTDEANINVKLVQALVKAMLAERDTNGLLVNVSHPNQVQAILSAIGIYPDAIVLLESTAESVEGARLLVSVPGALEQLLAAMDTENAATALAAVMMIAKLVAMNDSEVNQRLVATGAARAICTALKKHQEADFSQNGLYALRSMCQTLGTEAMGMSKEIMRIVQDLMIKHRANDYICQTAAALLQELQQAFADGTEALLEDRLRNFGTVHAQAGQWQEIVAEDGRVYYFNAQTNETSWTESTEHMALVQELDAMSQLVDQLDGSVSELDISTATTLVGVIGTHARDRRVLEKVVHIMQAQSSDKAQAKILAEQPRMADVVPAMALHPDNVSMLTEAASVLDRLTEFQNFRDTLSSLEYITVINNTVRSHMAVEPLVTKGLQTLGHLAFNNETNIAHCMTVEVPATINMAMGAHADEQLAVESSVYAAGNLLLSSDHHKIAVCNVCVDSIVALTARWQEEPPLFIKLLRLMGNLSLVDDCILEMVKRSAVTHVVSGMRRHQGAADVIKTALEVLSNFGAIEDDDLDEEATAYIINEGGITAIRDVLHVHDDAPDVLQAGMDALYNIGNDEEAAKTLVELGVLEITLAIIEKFDYEMALLRQCTKFLSVLTYSPVSVEKFAELRGVAIVVQAMESKLDSGDEDLLMDATLILSNSFFSEDNRVQMEDLNGVPVLLQILDLFTENGELVKYTVTALTRLAASDSMSTQIAESGMHFFMMCLTTHINDSSVIILIFEMFGQLAFVRDNLKVLVQHGGIKILLDAMAEPELAEDPTLMVKTIQTLDNVASADEEYATIVIEKGGKAAVETVMNMHPYDEDVKGAADSAILSMNAMSRVKDREGTKTSRGALFARLGDLVESEDAESGKEVEPEPEADPLGDFRNLLRTGQVVKHYIGGSSQNRHLFVSTDWRALLLKDTAKKAKTGMRIQLRNVRDITFGYGPDHFRKGMISGSRAGSDESCSLFINNVNEREALCLECSSEEDRDRWVSALNQLVKTFRLWPHRLM